MMHIETNINIQAKASEIFIYLTEPEKLLQWQTRLVEATQITDGEIEIGTKFRNNMGEVMGFKIEIIGEVIEFTPEQHLKIQAHSPIVDVTIEYTLHADMNGTTDIHQVGIFNFKGFFFKTIQTPLKDLLAKQAQTDLQQLKDLIEDRD